MLERVLRRAFNHIGKSIFKMRPLSNPQSTNAFSTAKLFDLELQRLVWIDMEMSGLNVDKDKILEVACVITDTDLNIIAEGPEIIINQCKETLEGMDEWCTKQHGKTGLTEACLKSQISLEQAEDTILDFLRAHVTPKSSPLAGNSVYMDRFFLIKHMPKIDQYLHYRIVDVSTIKELCRRWNTPVYKGLPKKEFEHRALNDIKESIDELRYYKKAFLKSS